MFSFKSIVLLAGLIAISESSAVPAVAAVAAPLVAPTHVGYARAVPQNILPYASQVSVVNRAINPFYAGPVAAPFAAPLAAPYAAPVAPFAPAAYAAPLGPAPYVAPAAGLAPSPFAAPLAASPYLAGPAPFAPYTAGAPLLRTPFGFAPTFVR